MAGTKIDSYQIIYSSNKTPRRIILKSGSGVIGQLVFYPLGISLPPDGYAAGATCLNYCIDDFSNCVDLLRNESPVFFSFANSVSSINTGSESVGELDRL
jgi:hypothetical protein